MKEYIYNTIQKKISNYVKPNSDKIIKYFFDSILEKDLVDYQEKWLNLNDIYYFTRQIWNTYNSE